MRVIYLKYCKKCMRSQRCRNIVMHWIFYTFFVKSVVETFFFSKAHFSEVLWLLQWVSFSGKDYYVLLLVLLVLNKFIEINTLIKRNLNFKYEVKSHKVRLQAYCNGYDVTSTRWEVATRLISNRCTCSRHLVTVAPPKVNNEHFSKSGLYVPMTSLPLWEG